MNMNNKILSHYETDRTEDSSNLCAPGTKCSVSYADTADGVKLRLIKFTPAEPKGNPAVVFIAGWITLIDSWKDVLQEMSKDFTIHYLETREKVSAQISRKEDFSVKSIGKDIAAYADNNELNDYILMGSSLGATAILDSSRFIKKKPLALILINPNAEFRVPRTWVIIIYMFYPPLYFVIKPAVKWYLKNFRLNTQNDLAQYEKYCRALDAADPWKLKKAVLSLRKYRIWDILPAVDTPSLFISASKDALHEPEKITRMTRLVRNSKLVDMETNLRAHSREMVERLREYLKESGFNKQE